MPTHRSVAGLHELAEASSQFAISQPGRFNWRCCNAGTGQAWPKVNYRGNSLLRPHRLNEPDLTVPIAGKPAIDWARYDGTFYWESKLIKPS